MGFVVFALSVRTNNDLKSQYIRPYCETCAHYWSTLTQFTLLSLGVWIVDLFGLQPAPHVCWNISLLVAVESSIVNMPVPPIEQY